VTNSVRRLLDQRDLLIAILYVVVAAASVLADVPLLRAVLVIPLVLFVPGYALVNALFPSLGVPTVERLLLSVASSLGLAIVTGLVLAFSGVGLSPTTWLFALVGLALIGLVGAAAQRVRNGTEGPRFRVATMSRLGLLAVLGAVLITVNVLLGARLIGSEQQTHPPLQLWMVPVAGQPLQAELGVHADDAGGEYTIVISSAGDVVTEYKPMLQPQETWQVVVVFTPNVRAQPIVARLYQPGATIESRFVVLQPVNNG
jgi:hypothetical protein